MDQAALRKYTRRLGSTIPLFGGWVRRRACRRLAADSGPETVPALAGALHSADAGVRRIADTALRSLAAPAAVEALCALWAGGREPLLGALVSECRYLATQPPAVRVLSALQADRPAGLGEEAANVPPLAAALTDGDETLRTRAEQVLRTLQNPAAIDALCECLLAAPAPEAARLVVAADYSHSVVSRRCLVLLLTGQLDRYLDLDFDLRYVRAEYRAGEEQLRRRIGEAVRQSGDTRLLGILRLAPEGAGGPQPADLSAREAEIAIEVYARHERWAEIFALLPNLPLSAVVTALDVLAGAGWQPEAEAEQGLLASLLGRRAKLGEFPPAPQAPGAALGPVFEQWLARGRSDDWLGLAPEQLRQLLAEAPPPEAVAALAALHERGLASAADLKTARTSPHWPVRLGYLALCARAPEVAFRPPPPAKGPAPLWTDRLAPYLVDQQTYRGRACALNPEQLDALARLLAGRDSPRAAAGRLLCVLAAHALRHTIEIDLDMIVELDETDIEIEG